MRNISVCATFVFIKINIAYHSVGFQYTCLCGLSLLNDIRVIN